MKDFPVLIDLEVSLPESPETISTSKASKRKIYPSLYISSASGLEDLPREGYALIHYKRRSITMGEDCCSADLEIHELRLPETSSEETSGDMGDALKAMAKERGIIENDEAAEDEEDTAEGETLALDDEGEEEE